MNNFVKRKNTYSFMLNLDWFQPYKHSQVSIGAFYLVCLNLPRKLRFKRENVIIVGLMPWLEHEPHSLDGFLRPIVDDFLTLWSGVDMCTAMHPNRTKIRAALLCTSSDLPATRKMNGFMYYNAKQGCSKCKIVLDGQKNCRTVRDYGKSFDKIKLDDLNVKNLNDRKLPWSMRSVAAHKREVQKIQRETKKSNRDKMISACGYKPTQLLRLPYFNTVRYHAIDVMHALYEGVAKRVFETWLKHKNQFSDKQLQILDERISKIKPPPDFERLPVKIGSCFRSFKAVQWMHFVLHYSPLVVTGNILPSAWYDYWVDFVLACRFINRTELTTEDAASFTYYFCRFAKAFKKAHGSDAVTPNFHVCLHIEDCVLDYGPVYSFWLFTFERYNGILGKYPANGHKDVEQQMMKRFYTQMQAERLKNDPAVSKFKLIFEKMSQPLRNNFSEIRKTLWRIRQFAKNQNCSEMGSMFHDLSCYTLPSRGKKFKLPERNKLLLLESYKVMYPDLELSLRNISETVVFYNSVTIGADQYIGGRLGEKHSYVLANYYPAGNSQVECAYVHRFMLHSLVVSEQKCENHLFAVITYYPKVTLLNGDPYMGSFRDPVIVCDVSKTIDAGATSYVPVQRILQRCLCITDPSCQSYRALLPCIQNCA